MRLFADKEVAHLECLTARDEAFERQLLSAGRVDAAAKKNGLTIDGFKALPRYEQRRLLFEVMEQG